jgi:hypothetical protein
MVRSLCKGRLSELPVRLPRYWQSQAYKQNTCSSAFCLSHGSDHLAALPVNIRANILYKYNALWRHSHAGAKLYKKTLVARQCLCRWESVAFQQQKRPDWRGVKLLSAAKTALISLILAPSSLPGRLRCGSRNRRYWPSCSNRGLLPDTRPIRRQLCSSRRRASSRREPAARGHPCRRKP